MSLTEVAAALGISVAAAKKRHVRALERIRERLGDESREGRR
jgi:DNA-directed RNA polymerase specialized sigma24 family protein